MLSHYFGYRIFLCQCHSFKIFFYILCNNMKVAVCPKMFLFCTLESKKCLLYNNYKSFKRSKELFVFENNFGFKYNFQYQLYINHYMSLVMRKPAFCICIAYAKTKTQISFAVTAKLISAFVFATWIVQSLYFLNPKFQASSHLMWLYSLVCIGPGRKPRRPVFSERGSYYK